MRSALSLVALVASALAAPTRTGNPEESELIFADLAGGPLSAEKHPHTHKHTPTLTPLPEGRDLLRRQLRRTLLFLRRPLSAEKHTHTHKPAEPTPAFTHKPEENKAIFTHSSGNIYYATTTVTVEQIVTIGVYAPGATFGPEEHEERELIPTNFGIDNSWAATTTTTRVFTPAEPTPTPTHEPEERELIFADYVGAPTYLTTLTKEVIQTIDVITPTFNPLPVPRRPGLARSRTEGYKKFNA
ncbi:hypothetical protein PT974_09942 [Cladobotryum mycophilum]|uniref:Uncharacterized protein n=1 Tax=Cladobotryum mycophilum TaxID=491253 RepID=A0ABR0S8Z7_9HYPO